MRAWRWWIVGLVLFPLILSGCQGGDGGRWLAFVHEGDGYVSIDINEDIAPSPPVVEVDLDADGRPEVARLEDGEVWIERDGLEVWRSKPEWRVVDIAAGDVGDDMRQELLLAMWRADEAGREWSQPYIIGYRRGRYDLIWGGSAVAHPICDFDLGDVNGDGQNELVVLEGDYEDAVGTPARRVTVWRWNGWGFTLLWQSEEGVYRDLYLLDVDDDEVPDIVVQVGELGN